MAIKMFEVLYGPVNTPMDEWEISSTHRFDPKETTSTYVGGHNMAPNHIQECYVRRANWDMEYRAKVDGKEVTHRYMMREVPAEQDWKARAEANGWTVWTYYLRDWQCPRLSEDRGHVTYYETEKDARFDRSKTIKTVRFLRQFYDEYDVERTCRRESIPYETNMVLKFCESREEVRKVYIHGPRSCMSGDQGFSDRGFHPTEAYFCAPITVAYLHDEDDPDHITARAVVNTETKAWVWIYGATTQMTAKLRDLGYRQDLDCLRGYKILHLPYMEKGWDGGEHESYELPYNDYHGRHVMSECRQFFHVR